MLALRLHVENIAGDWFGWIEDYPGAYSSGISAEEVEKNAPRAFADYLNWLRLHGEPLTEELIDMTSADFTARAVDIRSGITAAPRETRHFMPADSRPMRIQDLDRLARLLRYSRAELESAALAIPPHEWDSAPLGGMSIRSCLQSLNDEEAALIANLGTPIEMLPNADPLAMLRATRAAVEMMAHRLCNSGFDESAARARGWSMLRALRLALWNERVAAATIAARSNPSAYMRGVSRDHAVVRSPDVRERADKTTEAAEEATHSRHTHASAYYY